MNINKRSSKIRRIATKSSAATKNDGLRGKYGTTENNKADSKRVKGD